ncbi:MAG TPA: DUF2336 domain-containing protein [Alphaproteobacteria bacterium]
MSEIQQKIEALLDLARAEADQAKSRIADDLSEIIYVDGAPFSERELDIATDILRRLVRETESAVRQRMAERLAKDAKAPRDLVLALANDEFTVARPILAMSAALRDKDLIEIVRHKTRQHQLAVAARAQLSEAVSKVVAESTSPDVVAELLKNPSAKIAEATYVYIAERSKQDTELQAPLLHREDLPGEIAARMYGWVASELQTYIETKYRVAPQVLEAPLLDSLDEVAAEHRPEIAWDEATLKLADAIKAERLNDPTVLVRLLKNGHVSLFEALFARYLNIGIRLARRIVYQPDGRALAVACRAAGIERSVLSALLDLVRAEPVAALDLFRRISPQESLDVIARWRTREVSFAR